MGRFEQFPLYTASHHLLTRYSKQQHIAPETGGSDQLSSLARRLVTNGHASGSGWLDQVSPPTYPEVLICPGAVSNMTQHDPSD
ncbi:hypothetical protein RRG08_044538 [Elysia crispata]|uniref:Uncharacterized protein n=1 Tax=Elysia crispata TaxID=231223 RepID=A0AAE1DDE6_9GAST|nr:hypothetical protein RRG08_044538 [Elysia crispata]